MTIHALLDLNPDMESKLDFSKGTPKTAVLSSLGVLFIDEVSMIDVGCWQAVAQAFSVIDHTKRPHDRSGDAFGELHVLLFGDFKQLLPGASRLVQMRRLVFSNNKKTSQRHRTRFSHHQSVCP